MRKPSRVCRAGKQDSGPVCLIAFCRQVRLAPVTPRIGVRCRALRPYAVRLSSDSALELDACVYTAEFPWPLHSVA